MLAGEARVRSLPVAIDENMISYFSVFCWKTPGRGCPGRPAPFEKPVIEFSFMKRWQPNLLWKCSHNPVFLG